MSINFTRDGGAICNSTLRAWHARGTIFNVLAGQEMKSLFKTQFVVTQSSVHSRTLDTHTHAHVQTT